MIVCVCHRVSDRDIARVAREGCASFDELQLQLSVATSCGRCHDCARETFHQHAPRAEQGGEAVACAGLTP
jgi:bacterioferritin-associated ferredoxin